MRGLRGHPPPRLREAMLFRRCRSVQTFGMAGRSRWSSWIGRCGCSRCGDAGPAGSSWLRDGARHVLEAPFDREPRIGGSIQPRAEQGGDQHVPTAATVPGGRSRPRAPISAARSARGVSGRARPTRATQAPPGSRDEAHGPVSDDDTALLERLPFPTAGWHAARHAGPHACRRPHRAGRRLRRERRCRPGQRTTTSRSSNGSARRPTSRSAGSVVTSGFGWKRRLGRGSQGRRRRCSSTRAPGCIRTSWMRSGS